MTVGTTRLSKRIDPVGLLCASLKMNVLFVHTLKSLCRVTLGQCQPEHSLVSSLSTAECVVKTGGWTMPDLSLCCKNGMKFAQYNSDLYS